MVGAVGETASMKRRKLWKTGEDGLCCSSSAIQTRLDPSSLLEERSETPIFLLFLLSPVVRLITPPCYPLRIHGSIPLIPSILMRECIKVGPEGGSN